MTDKGSSLDKRLAQLEARQAKALALLTTLEDRLDVIHQEFQRTSTIVYRLNITQEAATSSDQRRDRLLEEMRAILTKIEARVGTPAAQ